MGGTQFTLCDCCSNAGCLQHVVCQADGTLVAQSFQRTAIAGKGKRTALRLASCLLLDDPPHRQRRGDHCLLDPSRSGEVSGSARSPVTTVRRSDSGKPAGPRSGRRLGGRHNLPRGQGGGGATRLCQRDSNQPAAGQRRALSGKQRARQLQQLYPLPSLSHASEAYSVNDPLDPQ